MRRSDREITDMRTILEILAAGDRGHLSLCDQGKPYGVTLNYGHTPTPDGLVLYFHCAKQGHKLDCIAANPNAYFFMETGCDYHEGRFPNGMKYYTMHYRSVAAEGTMSVVEDPGERLFALNLLMSHFPYTDPLEYAEESLKAVKILKLTATKVTAKQNQPKPSAN